MSENETREMNERNRLENQTGSLPLFDLTTEDSRNESHIKTQPSIKGRKLQILTILSEAEQPLNFHNITARMNARGWNIEKSSVDGRLNALSNCVPPLAKHEPNARWYEPTKRNIFHYYITEDGKMEVRLST